MCIYVYESVIPLRCLVGSSCAHYQNKLEKIFDDSLRENPWGKPKKTKNLEKTSKKQYLETLLESPIGKMKKTSRKPKKQKNKTVQRMFGLAHVCFFGFA